MSETSPLSTESLGAVLLVALLVCSAAAAVTGVGTAHGKSNHVTRNGSTLEIVVENDHFDTKDRNVTVSVQNAGSEDLSPKKQTQAKTIYEVPIANLSTPKTDLAKVNVSVKGKNGTLVSEREDLRVLRFGRGANAEIDGGGTLCVPLAQSGTLGYVDGSTVDVTLDGRTNLTGTVQYDGQHPSLVVSLKAGDVSLPVATKATIRVPNRGSTTIPLGSAVKRATIVGVTDGGQALVVDNPLLTSKTDYVLGIQTGRNESRGRFVGSIQTDKTGSLVVKSSALADAEIRNVSVYRSGNLVFEEYDPSATTDERLEATVSKDGTTVELVGDSRSAENVTVWLTNDTVSSTNNTEYVNTAGTVTNGRIKLESSKYRLNPQGTYRVIVTGDTYLRANISGPDNATSYLFAPPSAGNETGNSSASDSTDSLLGVGLDGDTLLVVLSGGAFLLVGLVALVVYKTRGGRGSATGGRRYGSQSEEYKLTVDIKDLGTKSQLDGEATITARHESGAEISNTVTNGREKFTVEPGSWTITVESNGVSDEEEIEIVGNAALKFELGPRTVEATVSDDDGEPLSNVRVACTPDTGRKKTPEINSRGELKLDVPLVADEVELSANPDKYEGDQTTVTFDGEKTARTSLSLRPRNGSLQVTATVDGTAIPGVGVKVTPREQAVRQLGQQERMATTAEDGTVTFDGLLVGRYEIEMEIPNDGDAFRTTSKRVEIRDGSVSRESLNAAFEYRLDRTDRDRITDIRQQAESLDSASGRDVAIPRYYGTVVTDLLDVVERIPDEGNRFATVEADPEEVMAAVLDVAEQTVRLVSNAMTTKRNTDLFGACVDMPDQRVEWTGKFDLETLFELLSEDRTAQRQAVLQQLRRVDDRIDNERSELAVISPAREPWERVQELVNAERGENLVRGATVAFVAGGLLDAVDELFDHEELRERLERTVF